MHIDAAGWLDEEREPAGLTPGEQQFLSLALKIYRSTNSDGRKKPAPRRRAASSVVRVSMHAVMKHRRTVSWSWLMA